MNLKHSQPAKPLQMQGSSYNNAKYTQPYKKSAGRFFKKRRLLGIKFVVIFGAVVVLILALLFHKEERLKKTFDLVQPDRISLLYLQLLVDLDPNDNPIRLALARQHAKLSNDSEAYAVLQPLIGQSGHEAEEGRLLALELDIKAYFKKDQANPSKERNLVMLKDKIAAIADKVAYTDLYPEVIRRSLELGRPDVAASIYERWAGIDGNDNLHRLKEAGKWYVASGLPLRAAELYNKAFKSTEKNKAAKHFAILAINAYRAADKGQLALDQIANYLGRFPNDYDITNEAIALSLAVNNPKQALNWGKLRLAMNPSDPENVNKQLDLALASAELDMAWKLSEHLLTLKPQDTKTHTRAAQIAEWTDKQKVALDHWAWVAMHDQSDNAAMENATRLATGLNDTRVLADLLTQLSERRSLTGIELNLMVDAANRAKSVEDAIPFFKRYLERYPVIKEPHEALAMVYEQTGNLPQALGVWTYIVNRFGPALHAITRQASLIWRTGKPRMALARLSQAKDKATATDTEFWQLYADLNWELKRTDAALNAYKALWKMTAANEITAERLIQLQRDKGQGEMAIQTAREAYRRFEQPRWLLLAMDTSVQFKSWPQLRKLMRTAEIRRKEFESAEMYWLIRAQYDSHNQYSHLALQDYRKALRLNPTSKIAKEGEYWALAELQNQVIARINKSSNQFTSTLSTGCVYKGAALMMGAVCGNPQ